jgi:hypothetical protein
MGKKLTTEDFIARAVEIHGKKFDYSESIYVESRHALIIICNTCGEKFKQTPDSHIYKKSGCLSCKNFSHPSEVNPRSRKSRRIMTRNCFTQKATQIHNNKYDYSQIHYVDYHTHIPLICPIHKITFNIKPTKHINSKQGCPKCSLNALSEKFRMSDDKFIEKSKQMHGDNYLYDKLVYINAHRNITLICKTHGDFEVKPSDHLWGGNGCPRCKKSKGEMRIISYLESNNMKYICEKKFNDCKQHTHLRFDIYIPSKNTCVEYDGEQHYRSVKIFGGDKAFMGCQIRDKIKTQYCLDNNIGLIRIPYWDFNNIETILSESLTTT